MARKFLFTGLGSIGQRHLRNLRHMYGDSAEVMAYRTRGEDCVLGRDMKVVPGATMEEAYGVRTYNDLEEALDEKPDVVFVTNPTSLHVETAICAIRAGSDVFIEKPLSNSMDKVPILEQEARDRKAVVMVGYQMRFHPAFSLIRSALERGDIGRITFARAEVGEYMPDFHKYEDYRRTYAARRDLGGGVTLSQIHEIDLLCALLGRPRIAFSMGGKLSDLEIDVDDVAMSLVEFEDHDGHVVPAHVHQDFVQSPPHRRCMIVGCKGKVEWDLLGGHLSIGTQSLCWDRERNQLYMDELAHFMNCVENRLQPDVDLYEATASLKTALAILESQKTKQPVTIMEY